MQEENLVKLKNVANDFEAMFITNILQEHNIPCIKKEREAGAYIKVYMGFSVFGADIYVNKTDYSAAKALIDQLPSYDFADNDDDTNDDDNIDNDDDSTLKPQEKTCNWPKILIRLWVILILLSILFSLGINIYH